MDFTFSYLLSQMPQLAYGFERLLPALCALNVDQGYKINSSLKIDNAVVEMKEN
ncbi:MAG: hypothetical protein ACFB2Y_00295 [Fulvivirga sp.]